MAKFCSFCGATVEDNAVCTCPASQAAAQQPQTAPIAESGNAKTFSILAYISILWLVGMLVSPEKEDPKVKFHVKQGFLAFILYAVGGIAWTIISSILQAVIKTRHEYSLFGYGIGEYYYKTPGFLVFVFGLIGFAIFAGYVVLAIMGIMNAVNGKEKELPVIGKFANKLTFIK